MTYVRPCRSLSHAEALVAQGSRIQVCNILQRSDLRQGRSSRLHRRERIETIIVRRENEVADVPPGFIAGSGLKHVRAGRDDGDGLFLPASSPGAD